MQYVLLLLLLPLLLLLLGTLFTHTVLVTDDLTAFWPLDPDQPIPFSDPLAFVSYQHKNKNKMAACLKIYSNGTFLMHRGFQKTIGNQTVNSYKLFVIFMFVLCKITL